MSLNGLDSEEVADAYNLTSNEPGGWFLLKYASRDQVQLLSCGRNGVSEARTAIQGHTEASPLYGLIIYRRRRVLIKFVPEGTSRLLQARTAVHFSDVREKYSPYETILEISNSDAFNDTSLASSFPLHTASASIASNRLHEISEDGEDPGASPRPAAQRASSTNSARGVRYKDRRTEQLARANLADSPSRTSSMASIETVQPSTNPSTPKPSLAQYLVREDGGRTSVTTIDSSTPIDSVSNFTYANGAANREGALVGDSEQTPTKSDRTPTTPTYAADPSRPRPPPKDDRMSRESAFEAKQSSPLPSPPVARDEQQASAGAERKPYDENDPYDLAKYDEWFKPKVKLGPRPVAALDKSRRPITASVAGLPPNLRMQQQQRKQEQTSTYSALQTSASAANLIPFHPIAPPPIPDLPEYSPRPVSRGSIKSMPSHRSTATTSDRTRLMKALELRKRQMRKSNPVESTMAPIVDESVPEVPKITEAARHNAMAVNHAAVPAPTTPTTALSGLAQANKVDSGIELIVEAPEKTTSAAPVPQVAEPTAQSSIPLISQPSLQVRTSQAELKKAPSAASLSPSAASPATQQGASLRKKSSYRDLAAPSIPLRHESSGRSLGRAASDSAQNSGNATPTQQTFTTQVSRPTSGTATPRVQPATTGPDFDQLASSIDEDFTPNNPDRDSFAARGKSDVAKRRRGFVQPLHADIDSGNPDDFNSDEEFIAELRDATTREAPSHGATPTLAEHAPTPDSSEQSPLESQQPTMPIDKFHPDAPQESSQSLSPTLSVTNADPMAGLSRNVSTGISRRIQALAEMTQRETNVYTPTSSPQQFLSDSSPNNFVQQDQRDRRISGKPAQRGRPASYRKRSSNRLSGIGMPNGPASYVPENNAVLNVQHDPNTNRNSVSVSARIVRATGSSGNENDLQQSELSLNPNRSSAYRPTANMPPYNAYTAAMYSTEELPRENVETRQLNSAVRYSHRPVRQSMQSPTPDDFPPPPTNRAVSRISLTSSDEIPAPKEPSRTSRFFKRMSALGAGVGGRRKSNATNQSTISAAPVTLSTPKEVNEAVAPEPVRASMSADTPPATLVGDLNVQFPDSLLWKRRVISIDDGGYISFTAPHTLDIHRNIPLRRYHITRVKQPYAPDLDAQELPYSVILELPDATILQVACEDAPTHRQVVNVLRNYWKAWSTHATSVHG